MAKSGTKSSGMSKVAKSRSPARSAATSAGSSLRAGRGATKGGSFSIVSRESVRRGKTDWAAVDALTDEEIEAAVRADPDAVPLDFDWAAAEVVVPANKVPISIRLDADILDFFKSTGPGYQRRINAVLRSYMQTARKTKRA